MPSIRIYFPSNEQIRNIKYRAAQLKKSASRYIADLVVADIANGEINQKDMEIPDFMKISTEDLLNDGKEKAQANYDDLFKGEL